MSETLEQKRAAKHMIQAARKKRNRRIVKQQKLETQFSKFENWADQVEVIIRETTTLRKLDTQKVRSSLLKFVDEGRISFFPHSDKKLASLAAEGVRRRPDASTVLQNALEDAEGNQLNAEMLYLLCLMEGDIEENLTLATQLPKSYLYAMLGANSSPTLFAGINQ